MTIQALTTDKAVKLFEEFRGIHKELSWNPGLRWNMRTIPKPLTLRPGPCMTWPASPIIPAVIKYTTQLASSIAAVKGDAREADVSTQTELLIETSKLLAEIKTALARLWR